jgi:hypothetical protein
MPPACTNPKCPGYHCGKHRLPPIIADGVLDNTVGARPMGGGRAGLGREVKPLSSTAEYEMQPPASPDHFPLPPISHGDAYAPEFEDDFDDGSDDGYGGSPKESPPTSLGFSSPAGGRRGAPSPPPVSAGDVLEQEPGNDGWRSQGVGMQASRGPPTRAAPALPTVGMPGTKGGGSSLPGRQMEQLSSLAGGGSPLAGGGSPLGKPSRLPPGPAPRSPLSSSPSYEARRRYAAASSCPPRRTS